MITAESIIRDAMRREGWKDGRTRLIDQASDRGGLTRGGITAKSWGAYLHLNRLATASELVAITEAQAFQFFTREYLVKSGFEAVPDPRLRALLVDWSLTSYFDDPTKALQASLARRALYWGGIDGVFGPKTRKAVANDVERSVTFRDVLNSRIVFYRRLAYDRQVDAFLDAHPSTQLHNLAGWLNRCLEFTP